MLKPDQKLAIHFFEQIDKLNGKMGHAVLRYSRNPVACAVDFNHKGSTTRDLLDFGPDVPVLGSVAEAADAGGEVLVLGMAPSGGRLPPEMIAEVDKAVAAGMSVINGLHEHLGPVTRNFPQGSGSGISARSRRISTSPGPGRPDFRIAARCWWVQIWPWAR